MGTTPIPHWCGRYIMPFKRLDGSTGYEYWGRYKDYILEPGDVITRNRGQIRIRRGNRVERT